ncbi:MAG: FMN-binding glutamate synthase family protein [Gammaproteobacteria bacterium]
MKKLFLIALVVATLALLVAAQFLPWALWGFVVLGPILLIGIYDLTQTRHTILRNYPIIGHMRYLLEDARHHIRQYLIQGDQEGDPFTRPERAVVYQRAKKESDVQPFGTLLDTGAVGYEWFEHSVRSREPAQDEARILVGNDQCTLPYSASRLNISAMSFGSLGSHAIEALNAGARDGGFAHNTGEGGISRYHREPGGDLIWQLGTGYFGARAPDGGFDPAQFKERSALQTVRMIEVKLSQGAKPGGGGILPAAKVTADIAKARGVPEGRTVHSPAAHSRFSTPVELLEFLNELRELSGGKPVGFKLCIGQRREFMAMLKAMIATGIVPDFITVDGSEGGTGAAPRELTDHVGLPLRDGLVFAHNALVGAGLRDQVRVICSGKIINGFDLAAKIAMGADLCNSARGMMFALGCIQARRCQANTCPTGIATQDPWRMNGLVVADKVPRVTNYHRGTIKHFLKVLAACGLDDATQLSPQLLYRRVSATRVNHYAELYDYLEIDALKNGDGGAPYQPFWDAARPETFA